MAAKLSRFFAACGEGAELFEVVEEVFGERTPLGHFEGARNQTSLVAFRRHGGACALLIQPGAQPIMIEGVAAKTNFAARGIPLKMRPVMPLKSELFFGDTVLEACAVKDSAHVTLGAVGDHVSKIQTALVALDGANIDPNELVASLYGRSTANAVLAYKKKRSIINFSYQTQADDIVGKMTIAALDKEMVEFERRMDSSTVCHCRDFPRALEAGGGRRSAFRLAFAVSGLTVGAVLSGSPKDQALGRLDGAKKWVAAARNFIRIGEAQILSGLPINNFKDTEQRKALVTHFKVDQVPVPSPINHLDSLDKVYQLIEQTFASANSIFINDPTTQDFANAHHRGLFLRNDPVLGKIRFGPPYGGKGELFQTAVLVHEAAHFVVFVNKDIDHFASELPAPNGTAVNSSTGIAHSKNYAQLSFQEAAENAYTYAQFALHAFKGFDKRIVPFNE